MHRKKDPQINADFRRWGWRVSQPLHLREAEELLRVGSMIIQEVIPLDGAVLRVVDGEGRIGIMDLGCYLTSPVFAPLKSKE